MISPSGFLEAWEEFLIKNLNLECGPLVTRRVYQMLPLGLWECTARSPPKNNEMMQKLREYRGHRPLLPQINKISISLINSQQQRRERKKLIGQIRTELQKQ